jgi:hypothetical protein
MDKIDWKRKLTSRKFWTAAASFIALLIAAMGGTENQASQITAIVMAGATVIAYIVGEGLIDSASVTVNGGAEADTTGGTGAKAAAEAGKTAKQA